MTTLCIIPCGKNKIWDVDNAVGPMPAKETYTDPFHKKCRQYAQFFYPNSWVILSAKYVFFYPNDLISGPYNVTFNDKKTNPINHRELSSQAYEKGFDKYD